MKSMISKILAILLFLFVLGCDDAENKGKKPKSVEEIKRLSVKNSIKKFAVGLHYKGNFFCSGSIVDKRWVLTAGHCLAYLKEENQKFLTITFGEDQNNPDHRVEVDSVERPTPYKTESGGRQPYWDITLVKLKQDIPKGYEPINLAPLPPLDIQNLEGYMLGWGVSAYGADDAGNLKLSKGKITEYYDKGFRHGLARIQFEANGPCSGDSGGGFYVQHKGKWYLVATVSGMSPAVNKDVDDYILSTFFGEADICQLNEATFASLSTYSEWIRYSVPNVTVIDQQEIDWESRVYTDIKNWCYNQYLTDDEKYLIYDQIMEYGESICEGNLLPIENSKLKITRDVLSHGEFLSGLVYLESLFVKNSMLFNIPSLSKLTGLKSVLMVESAVSGFSGLAEAPNLKRITLISVRVSKSDMVALVNAPSLKALEVIENDLLESIPQVSEERSQLKSLTLKGNKIYELKGIGQFIGLKKLNLSNNNIFEIEELAKLGSLQALNLSGNNIKDISALGKFESFQVLNLEDNPINVETCPSEKSSWWRQFCSEL